MRGRVHPNRPKNLRPQTHPTTRSDRCFYLSQRAGTTECFWPCSTEAIQDPASELPKILLTRTPVNKGEKRSYFRRRSSGCPYQYHTNTAPSPTALTAAATPPNRTSVIKKMAPIIARARKANPPMLRRLAALSLSSLACWRHSRRWWEEGAMSSAAEIPVHSSVAKYTYRCCGVTEENP